MKTAEGRYEEKFGSDIPRLMKTSLKDYDLNTTEMAAQ